MDKLKIIYTRKGWYETVLKTKVQTFFQAAAAGDSYGAPQAAPLDSGDSYGAPQAAPLDSGDSYGAPQADPIDSGDSYGAPQAAPVSAPDSYGAPQAAPVQAQVSSLDHIFCVALMSIFGLITGHI